MRGFSNVLGRRALIPCVVHEQTFENWGFTNLEGDIVVVVLVAQIAVGVVTLHVTSVIHPRLDHHLLQIEPSIIVQIDERTVRRSVDVQVVHRADEAIVVVDVDGERYWNLERDVATAAVHLTERLGRCWL